MARKVWYDEVRRCRRRHQIPGLARGVCDPEGLDLSYFVANLPSSALGIAVLFTARNEFERLALRCTRSRVTTAISARGLHAIDAFRIFNVSRTGLMTCGELWGGLEWLGLSHLKSEHIHELMRLLDRDNDGLLALHEFKLGFTEARIDNNQKPFITRGRISDESSQVHIKVKSISEVALAGADANECAHVSLSQVTLHRMKVKACSQTSFISVWSSCGVGAHTDCGVWAPNVSLGMHKANRQRLYLGHYAQRGLTDPSRNGKKQQMTIELTDLNVLRLKSSASVASVIAELFPPPLRWHQVWNTIGKRIKDHLYAWTAVPPSSDFVQRSANDWY